MLDKDLNIAVGVPSTDVWVPKFGLAFAAMCAYFGMKRIGGAATQRLQILSSTGSMLSQLRENLVLSAMREGCSHLLMLDSDMKFPRDSIHRLLAHGKDIVAANCTTKVIPAEPTGVLLGGARLYTDPDSTGLVGGIESIGTAVMMFRLDIFKKIPRPWFYQEWAPEIQHFIGEDRYFCHKARACGFEVFVDQDISKLVTHIGPFEYGHDVVGEIIKESKDAESKAA